jgi:hypothetical protein
LLPGDGHEDVAGSAVLAFEAAGVAGVLVLAVFADIFCWTTERERKKTLINYK